jgi:glycerate kinase
MRVLIAPDKWKGTLSALEVVRAVQAGLGSVVVDECPLADGGDGFVEAMRAACGGMGWERRTSVVCGPLADEPRVEAEWGMFTAADGTRTAVVEMAQASGLWRCGGLLRPLDATTYGTGELLVEAVTAGAGRILLGIGGSATVDAGLGCCQAVGHTVLMKDGEPVDEREPLRARDLERVLMVKRGRGSQLDRVPVEVGCDVTNPLCGVRGAAAVFGPQKGATAAEVAWLDEQHAGLARRSFAIEAAETPGAGAAGGLGFAMLAFFNARLVSGFDLVAEAVGLEARVAAADVVITGEGRVDEQSLMGKTVGRVAGMAKAAGKRCVVVCGSCSLAEAQWRGTGVTEVLAVVPGLAKDVEEAKGLGAGAVTRMATEWGARRRV